MSIKMLKDKSGWEFAVVADDPNAGAWCEQSQRLDYDRSVEDVLKRLKSGDIVLDAGACIGPYTVPMAKAVGPDGCVIAFEPTPETFQCLKHNCRDLGNVQLYNLALGETFYRRSILGTANVGANFLSSSESYNPYEILPFADVVALDSYMIVPKLNLIKMDVEGFEPLVIRGAIETIKRHRPIIFCEINQGALARYGFTRDDVIKPLESIGYKLQLNDPRIPITSPQLDVFFNP